MNRTLRRVAAPRRLPFTLGRQRRKEPKVKSEADFAPQGARSTGRLCSAGGFVRGSASALRDGSVGVDSAAVTSVSATGKHGGFGAYGTRPQRW
mgnify:CR=1 FL=1